ncbi:hypothetical protein NIES2107_49740 [Nostoc carneum NIES-2107]|nr:hypothetical protein NIES2107_49740 [Nostoc carneum NIES-2107]
MDFEFYATVLATLQEATLNWNNGSIVQQTASKNLRL